jgi:hypothetical protein
MQLEELIDQSALIFTGTMVYSEVVLSQDGSFPFTFVTFRVDDQLKGSVRNKELTLRLHGGETATGQVVVEGTPSFEKGERYLLFVRSNGVSSFPVTGWSQGQYRFEKHPKSGREILVDDEDRVLLGVQKGNWLRGEISLSAEDKEPAAVLLSQEGVKISEAASQAIGVDAADAADPNRVLGELRSFIRSRSGKQGFAPGKIIESARADEVPVSVGGTVVPSPIK